MKTAYLVLYKGFEDVKKLLSSSNKKEFINLSVDYYQKVREFMEDEINKKQFRIIIKPEFKKYYTNKRIHNFVCDELNEKRDHYYPEINGNIVGKIMKIACDVTIEK